MARSTDISPISQLLSRVDAVADGAPAMDTIASGFPSLDRMLGGGLRRGDLVILGGDVASGKSALALAVALRAAGQHAHVAFYSADMTPPRVMERALAIEGRVRVDDLRQGSLSDEARAAVGAAAVRLRDAMPAIDRMPAGGVAALAADLETRPDVELVIVDGLESLVPGAGLLDEELAATARQLKALALDVNVAIFCTSHLPGLAAREDRWPHLDDFGAMGAVKQHADVVLALFREGMYDPRREIEGATELLVRKNRNGATGYVDLYFYAQWLRFEDVLDPDR
ncbi:MAG TPA: DnaB-like helicase C-terminal domain-containing protein, partial [Gemmatimonadaceae bacterium]|nr:DnaB-like helicase C-terminal domain-containing protein [Gemmatimonadaceae bacterium]